MFSPRDIDRALMALVVAAAAVGAFVACLVGWLLR